MRRAEVNVDEGADGGISCCSVDGVFCLSHAEFQ